MGGKKRRGQVGKAIEKVNHRKGRRGRGSIRQGRKQTDRQTDLLRDRQQKEKNTRSEEM